MMESVLKSDKVLTVAEGIYRIDPQRKGDFCLSYLISGGKSALIDPGPTSQVDIILRAMEEELSFDPESLSYIIPTHVHVDHSGGAGYMARKFPQAQVVVHERGKRHMVDPSRLVEASKKAFGPDFQDELGPVLPIPEDRLLPVKGGEKLDLGGRELEIIYTPGHASHHLCFYDKKSRGVFCGDALGMYLPDDDVVVPITPDGFDLELALETISKIRGLSPQLLFYPHCGVGREADSLIRRAKEELINYRDIILASLKAGENQERTAHRLEDHINRSVSKRLVYDLKDLNLYITITGFEGYFRKMGLI